MRAVAGLRRLSSKAEAVQALLPAQALSQLLSHSLEEVKSDTSLLETLSQSLQSQSSTASQVASVLINNQASWKVFVSTPQIVDSLFSYLGLLKPVTEHTHYCDLLFKGASRDQGRIFLPDQASKVLKVTCAEADKVNWKTMLTASQFMKQQKSLDPYLLDQFTARCLAPTTPLDVVIEYLYATWNYQPINYELEWNCRARLRKSWHHVHEKILMKSILLLLKSTIRGDMLIYLQLLERIDLNFIHQLRSKELIMCLGLLAKCRSKQLYVSDTVFEDAARRCREIVQVANTRELMMIGKALSQVNYGGNEFYSMLRRQAEEKKDRVEFLEFLEKTVAPSVENL